MQNPNKKIGQAIRKRRVAEGLKQSELAEIAGLNTTTISNAESGKTLKSMTLSKILDALGVDDFVVMTKKGETLI